MPKIAYIRWTERVVGEGHPSREDVLNRPLKQLLEIAGWDPDSNDVKTHHFPLGVYADDVYARTGGTQIVHPAVHMLDNLDVDGTTHLLGDLVVDGDVAFNGWISPIQLGVQNSSYNTGPVGDVKLGFWHATDAAQRYRVAVKLDRYSSFETDHDSTVNFGIVNFKVINTPGSPTIETLKWWYKPYTINNQPLFEHRLDTQKTFFILGPGGGGIKSGAFPEGDIVRWRVESAAPNPGSKNVCEWATDIELRGSQLVLMDQADIRWRDLVSGTNLIAINTIPNTGWTTWGGGVRKDASTATTLAELTEVVGTLINALKNHHGLLYV